MRRLFSIALFFISTLSIYAVNSLNLFIESSKIGVSVYWDSLSETGMLEKAGHQISFRADDPFVLRDYEKITLTDAPELKDGMIYVSPNFMDDVKDFFKSDDENLYKIGAILIDPGHGGDDPGANAVYKIKGKKVTVNEKDINLNASLILYSMLKKAYPDKQILLTRSTDKKLPLGDRTDIANSVKLNSHEAILYISIHSNSHNDKNVKGYEVWYLSPEYRRTVITPQKNEDKELSEILNSLMEEEYTTESVLIARLIMNGIKEQVGTETHNRGIKAEEWFVVRNSNMPAVLVELGFVSNEKEAKNLLDENYLKKLSLGIYNGISAFVTHFEHSRGFTEIK